MRKSKYLALRKAIIITCRHQLARAFRNRHCRGYFVPCYIFTQNGYRDGLFIDKATLQTQNINLLTRNLKK